MKARETVYIATRVPRDLAERIDAHVRELQAEQPLVSVTRSDALRILIDRGLK